MLNALGISKHYATIKYYYDLESAEPCDTAKCVAETLYASRYWRVEQLAVSLASLDAPSGVSTFLNMTFGSKSPFSQFF